MTVAPRERLADLLADLSARSTFSARQSVPPDDLSIEIRGVGPLRVPVPAEQARQLRAVARPAPYGHGEDTLTDRRVRDTWQIPKARVTIDQHRWNRTLTPVLDRFRAALGLPEGCRLKAELHSMLLYSPGQFFVPHQDSEKSDDMVATLVVMLPAASRGGSLIVQHGNDRATYRSSDKRVTFVAFYADCRHEVRPLTSGHRVVLTYNLLLRGTPSAAGSPTVPPRTLAELQACLGAHFEASSSPDTRLVYLLDHQYTTRGLGWARLKGSDATRGTILRQAAQESDCCATLALAEVHELWTAYDEDEYEPRWRRGSWYGGDEYDEDDDDEDDLDGGDGSDSYQLEDLIESEVLLRGWLDEPGAPAARIASAASEDEVCSSTPSAELTPTSSEYEGYMGNDGNTLDRWYHRGAVVLWPRRYDFAVRAAASPRWAVGTLLELIRDGETASAREQAVTLERFWGHAVGSLAHPDPTVGATPVTPDLRALFGQTLQVANDLADPALTQMLLGPFHMEWLAPAHAAVLADLAGQDPDGTRQLITTWGERGGFGRYGWQHDPTPWVTELPALCTQLHQEGARGTAAPGHLLGLAGRQDPHAAGGPRPQPARCRPGRPGGPGRRPARSRDRRRRRRRHSTARTRARHAADERHPSRTGRPGPPATHRPWSADPCGGRARAARAQHRSAPSPSGPAGTCRGRLVDRVPAGLRLRAVPHARKLPGRPRPA